MNFKFFNSRTVRQTYSMRLVKLSLSSILDISRCLRHHLNSITYRDTRFLLGLAVVDHHYFTSSSTALLTVFVMLWEFNWPYIDISSVNQVYRSTKFIGPRPQAQLHNRSLSFRKQVTVTFRISSDSRCGGRFLGSRACTTLSYNGLVPHPFVHYLWR